MATPKESKLYDVTKPEIQNGDQAFAAKFITLLDRNRYLDDTGNMKPGVKGHIRDSKGKALIFPRRHRELLSQAFKEMSPEGQQRFRQAMSKGKTNAV